MRILSITQSFLFALIIFYILWFSVGFGCNWSQKLVGKYEVNILHCVPTSCPSALVPCQPFKHPPSPVLHSHQYEPLSCIQYLTHVPLTSFLQAFPSPTAAFTYPVTLSCTLADPCQNLEYFPLLTSQSSWSSHVLSPTLLAPLMHLSWPAPHPPQPSLHLSLRQWALSYAVSVPGNILLSLLLYF